MFKSSYDEVTPVTSDKWAIWFSAIWGRKQNVISKITLLENARMTGSGSPSGIRNYDIIGGL